MMIDMAQSYHTAKGDLNSECPLTIVNAIFFHRIDNHLDLVESTKRLYSQIH